MAGKIISAEEFNNLPDSKPRKLPLLTEEEFNALPQEEGLGVGYGEDLLLGAVGGAAANIIGKPLMKAASNIPGIGKAAKYVDDKIDDGIEWVDDMLPDWLGTIATGKEKPTINSRNISPSKPSNGITTSHPNEAVKTTVEYRNNVLRNGESADGVQHIDPRWYDEFQDPKNVRLGGGKEDDLLTRSMLSRLSPVSKTREDLLLDIRKIEEARRAPETFHTNYPPNFKGLKGAEKERTSNNNLVWNKDNPDFPEEIVDSRKKLIDEELRGLYAKADNAGGELGNAVKTIPAAAITGGMFGPAAGGTALLLPYGAKMSEQFLKTRARDNYVKTIMNKAGVTDDISPYLERPIGRAVGSTVRRGTVGAATGAGVGLTNGIVESLPTTTDPTTGVPTGSLPSVKSLGNQRFPIDPKVSPIGTSPYKDVNSSDSNSSNKSVATGAEMRAIQEKLNMYKHEQQKVVNSIFPQGSNPTESLLQTNDLVAAGLTRPQQKAYLKDTQRSSIDDVTATLSKYDEKSSRLFG